MTSTNNHFLHHQALLQSLYQHCRQQLPFSSEQASDTDREFLAALQQLAEAGQHSDSYNHRGQLLIGRIVANYPHITPAVNRDLFWYFGGDCLHFMADQEIALYQQLDQRLFDDDSLEFAEIKAKVFQLH